MLLNVIFLHKFFDQFYLSYKVRKVQTVIEDIRSDIASKRKSAALDGVKKARTILGGKDADKIKSACRESTLCASYIEQAVAALDPLALALKDSQEAFNGSEQERAAQDRAYAAQKNAIDCITLIEEQMVPPNYKVPVPSEYKDLPQLQGRSTVEMTIVRPNKGETFDVYGSKFNEAKMTMIIDGYSSPLTAGNFIELVQKGFYNKMEIQRADGFVVQTGDPEGDAVGYVGKGSPAVGNGPKGERLIPLEIFVKGDKAPIYETGIEDEGRGGEATVLPFSSYGAMGWAREEYDNNSGSSQFFWLLFDSDLTPAGKNVLDGRYPWYAHLNNIFFCYVYLLNNSSRFFKILSASDMLLKVPTFCRR
jgi:peptidylprolyl isomerase